MAESKVSGGAAGGQASLHLSPTRGAMDDEAKADARRLALSVGERLEGDRR